MFQAEILAYQEEWQKDSLCRTFGEEINGLFFSDNPEDEAKAKAICFACPVRMQCLNFAYRRSIDHGMFGGLADRERRSLLKTRGRKGLAEMFAAIGPEKELV